MMAADKVYVRSDIILSYVVIVFAPTHLNQHYLRATLAVFDV